MRIGMMADMYKPYISGVTNYISLNKQHLERLGHKVYVFTFSAEGYEDDETRIIRSPGMPLLDTGIYFSLRYTQEARHLLQTMDVVHVHHPFLSGPLALLYCKRRGIPVVFTNHTRYDLYAQAYLPNMPEVIGTAALQAYLPSFCRSCSLVISPSAGMREVLLRLGVDAPVEVVPNGVDLEPFMDPPVPVSREDLGISSEDVVWIFIGRLGPEKNLAFLLRSFAGAAQAFENLRLILIGDGPERDNLKDQVEHADLAGRVQFLGQVPYGEVPGYMAMADAFVTASVTEVHPLTVIEAMAAGLPVLGIQSPGVGDTVVDGETGYLVPDEDLATFTAKMVRLSVDREAREQMAENARRASGQYSIKKTVKLMMECYDRVIQQASGRPYSERKRSERRRDPS